MNTINQVLEKYRQDAKDYLSRYDHNFVIDDFGWSAECSDCGLEVHLYAPNKSNALWRSIPSCNECLMDGVLG